MSYVEKINSKAIVEGMQEKVVELVKQPEYQWGRDKKTYATVANDLDFPDIKVGIANCTMDFDIWQGLRNPAKVGLYPAGLEQIWEFWASNHKKKTDEDGRSTIFQLPPSFELAKEKYNRAMIITVMLPVSPEIFREYNQKIKQGAPSWPVYSKVNDELSKLVDQAATRLSFDLINQDRMVVVMNGDNVKKVTEQTVPMTHRGRSHGACKGGNYSQKSMAVLTGLGQFGVSRLVFRDEVVDDKMKRFIGPIRSFIIFDKEPVVTDKEEGIFQLTEEWLEKAHALADFTNNDPEINKYRFCTHIVSEGEKGCALCLTACPSGALVHSTPEVDGEYAAAVKKQSHRFYQDALQFDYANCCDERGQKANLYDEWICSHCITACGDNGVRRRYAVENYNNLLFGEGI